MIQIKNGIVASDTLKIIQALIPIKHANARPRIPMKPKYITIHNTGNEGVSAGNNSNYVITQNGYKSWHFTVGADEIFQHLPVNEISWHAGDGANGPGNNQSISIEIAEVDKAEETAVKFVAELLQVTGISIENVTTHQHWSGKYCPRLILKHWNVFISNIERELIKGQNMTLEDAEKIIQSKTGFDNNTMKFLHTHPYSDAFILKMAKAMQN